MAGLPKTIHLPDGRTIPFEPEQIGRDLFAVTEQQGRPDTFLARELTDGVLHFLAESDADSIVWSDLTELVAKVIRELGRPAEAILYESSHREPPRSSVAPSPTVESEWYSRDLLSAHADGLLILTDRKQTRGCAVVPVGPFGPLHPQQLSWNDVLQRRHDLVHGVLAIDGPEYALAVQEGDAQRLAHDWVECLGEWLRASGCRAIVNLNIATPPSWAADLAMGPLFAAVGNPSDPIRREELIDAILDEATRYPDDIHIHYHLSEPQWNEPAISETIVRLNNALARGALEVVFDRPKQPIRLGSGLQRGDPAVLSIVGIRLPHFIRQLGTSPLDQAVIVKKLASLTRFAKAAGHARQDYLRRTGNSAFQEGFFLDRAVTVVVPVGLGVAARLASGPHGSEEAAFELATVMLTTIRDALENDRSRIMPCRVDSPWSDPWIRQFQTFEASGNEDLTSIDWQETSLLLRQQIRYAAVLHQAAEGGRCSLSNIRNPVREELEQLLGFALRSGIRNLRFE